MRLYALTGSLCLLLWSLSTVAAQTNDCATAECDRQIETVRIGYTQFPPFSFTNSLGTAKGYSIDLLRQFLEPQGYALSFVEHGNPAELLESLEAGRIDATTLLAITDERAQIGRFTRPFEQFSSSLFFRSGERVTDLSGLRVGLSRGSNSARLLEAQPGAVPVLFDSSDLMLLALLSKDVDAIAGPTRAFQHQINRSGLDRLVEDAPSFINNVASGILVRPDRPTLVADLNRSIETARQSGQIAALQATWFAKPPRSLSHVENRFLNFVAVVLCLGLLLWIRAFLAVRRQARALDARTRQLHGALDATGATFLLADADMRIVWWNEAFQIEYPALGDLLRKDAQLGDYIQAIVNRESAGAGLSPSALLTKAHDRIARLRSGEELSSITTTVDGRVLKQRLFKLPSGEFGAISTDVSEMAEERDRIRLDADRLEETNKRLERFSQIVAHDLVAPIRNQGMLLGFIREDLARAEVSLPAEVHDYFEQAEMLLQRQSQLVTDLLAWSKSLHAGPPENFLPAGRARNAVSLAAVPPGFEVSLPDDFPRLNASPVAWELVMRNLISNAIKHHDKETGEVRVSFRVEGPYCIILVADDGPGIPSLHLSRIFDPFETLNSKDAGGGSGIGLSFVREAVEAWGGRVEALDTKGARGACFRFSVPLADVEYRTDLDTARSVPLRKKAANG